MHMIFFVYDIFIKLSCCILVLISNLIPQYCSILNELVTHLLFRKQYFTTIVSCTQTKKFSVFWKDKECRINKQKKTDSNTTGMVI